MPYPKHLLNPGEEIAIDANPHWWYFAEVGAAGFGLLILAFLVFSVGGDVGKVLKWLWFIAFGVGLCVFGVALLADSPIGWRPRTRVAAERP